MSTIALPEPKRLPSGSAKRAWSPWQKWGLILLAPYLVVFIVFVMYPVGYGLWLARHPASYERLVEDPIFLRAVLNNENVWAKAMSRVVNDNVSVDKAVDEMIARIKQVAG